MEAKHTPGPWASRGDNGKFLGLDPWSTDNEDCGNFASAAIRSDAGVVAIAVQEFDGYPSDVSEIKANCDLIAAAPDLLEALVGYMNASALAEQAMKDGINVHGAVAGLIGWTEMAHAAIAKATGASNG